MAEPASKAASRIAMPIQRPMAKMRLRGTIRLAIANQQENGNGRFTWQEVMGIEGKGQGGKNNGKGKAKAKGAPVAAMAKPKGKGKNKIKGKDEGAKGKGK
eukprot:4531388-Heterocapsa_arctica.AAC.1